MPGRYIPVMNARDLCLALLNFEPMSGYEIRKLVDEGTVAHFAEASYGAIYPALDKMQAEGLVTSHEERAPGKPPRRVFSLTAAGKRAFRETIHRMPAEDVYRSPFLLIAASASEVDHDHMVRVIDQQLRWARDELRRIEEERAHCPDDPRGEGWRWTMDYAVEMFTTSIRWLEANRARLEALAVTAKATRSDQSDAVAAPGE